MWARSQTSGDCNSETCAVSCSSESGSSSAMVRARACSSAATSSEGDTELGQPAEDQRGDHRSLADRGRDALRGAVADVAGGKEPDAARLEGHRSALERPTLRRAAVDDQVLAGE